MTTAAIKPAPIRKTLTVKASPDRAFEVFTAGFDRWWPRGHHIGKTDLKTAVIEPREGGRWYEICVDGSECDWGRVLDWNPPQGSVSGRLLLAWQLGADWQFHPEMISEVEVLFTDVGEGRTRVDFEHRHLERLGMDAEAAKGLDSENGWGGILALYAEQLA